MAEEPFQQLASPDRCLALLEELKRKGRRAKPKNSSEKKWSLGENKMSVTTKHAANGFSLSLKATDADAFGTYLSGQLEELYAEFQRQQKKG